ncbi:MAG: TRAP transporter substrate-binding protein [Firmicutes bacterium]|nr:TRAP transporter substrate-binding protein [Bacillota bacterium]
MKRMMLAVSVLVALALVSTSVLAAPRVIKLGHVVNERDGFHIAAMKFKELVEARSNGALQIQIYPNAQLGDERTLLEGMQLGTIDMGVITNGPVSNFLPRIAVFELPFLFSSPQDAYKVLDGPTGKKLLGELEKVGLKGLAYAERGFRNLTNSRRPVATPDDVRGLKVRVMENKVYIATFKALGANAVPMAWTEALTALQQGTIDGQENPVNVIYAFKLWETQKYLSMTRHTYAPALFVMGLRLFRSLPAAQQQLLVECAQAAAEYERAWNAEQEADQLKEIEANGMKIIQPDLAKFKAAVEGVYQEFAPGFGELLKEIQSQL